MTIIQRVSKLLTANVHQLLDKAENPEVMVRQLIRDMEESIIELRRETHKAVSQEKLLEKKIEINQARQQELEGKAARALEQEDEQLAKELLAKKVDLQFQLEQLTGEHQAARQHSKEMKDSLVKLEDQVQTARRKKEEIIRRTRLAKAKLMANQQLNPDASPAEQVFSRAEEHIADIERFQDQILLMEAEAEALESMNTGAPDPEKKLDQQLREQAAKAALEKLKKKQKRGKP